MRKVLLCLGLMAMVAFSSYAPAATTYIQWTGTAGDGLWSTAGNWSTGVVPNATDNSGVLGNPDYKAGFKSNSGTNYANLTSGTVTTDILVAGGGSAVNPGHFVVGGATVNVSQYITLAAATNDYGLMTVNSGTVNTGAQIANQPFYVSQKGAGTLQMNGGTIYVGNYKTPATALFTGNLNMSSIVAGETTGVGTLKLDGGTIYANDLIKGNGGGSLVITDGTLVLKTDRRSEIAGYTWITTTKVGGSIATSYDSASNTTTVYATPEPATICLLGIGLALVRRIKK